MSDALIGYTGFVGSNLHDTGSFDALFNSRNITDIRGRRFGRIVCAGVTAAKWLANKNPEEDLARIGALTACLDTVEADRFVLISTVDVYGQPSGVSERDIPPEASLHVYGHNRLLLERRVRDRFANAVIVRLPGLFGPRLKKNVIFDLMHDNMLDTINPDSMFQWYPLRRLAADLARIEAHASPLINVVAEPVATRTIQAAFFPDKTIGRKAGPAAAYDVRTDYAGVLGGESNYHLNARQVMDELRLYLTEARVAG